MSSWVPVIPDVNKNKPAILILGRFNNLSPETQVGLLISWKFTP